MIAMVALISAGCSNAPAETGAGSRGGGNANAANNAEAVNFAQCMRENGVRTFPDPDASGRLTIDEVVNGSSVDPSSAAWKKAIRACTDLQPPGHKRSAKEQEKALKFAQHARHRHHPVLLLCGTANGVENALSVPVTAIVGKSGGGFAVEVVRDGERRELVAVELGLFDTAGGRVQAQGDLREGDHVVVPSL